MAIVKTMTTDSALKVAGVLGVRAYSTLSYCVAGDDKIINADLCYGVHSYSLPSLSLIVIKAFPHVVNHCCRD